MNCDESLNLIGARLDGELSPDDRVQLDAHLAECAACRGTSDAMTAQHVELSRAFAPRRRAAREVAERVIAQLPRRSAWRIPWMTMIVSAAAGFAVAFGVFHRPAERTGTNPIAGTQGNPPTTVAATKAAPVAQLALATGAVEMCCVGDTGWSPMPTGGEVAAGTRVRTGPDVRCELKMSDGSEVRLNAGTEVKLASPRRVELAGGQMWSTVAHAETPHDPFEARAGDAVFTAMGTQFDLQAQPTAAILTVVDGTVRVNSGKVQDTVRAGEQMRVEGDGRLGSKEQIYDLALATRWVNEILVMKGRDNPEMAKRIDDLFARIGQEKMSYMYEEEIRALGDHCVIPLTRYIQSDRSKGDQAKRAIAAHIVSDVAPQWAIPELIKLLGDNSGEVRFYAATGLQRLTHHTHGRSPEQWRTDNVYACRPSMEAWQTWWKENRERYPGVPPQEEPPDRKVKAVEKVRAPLQKG
jgi:hypothetical protein